MRTSLPHPAGARVVRVPLTPFIGRDRELAMLRGLLTQSHVRLITLTGPGGVGKTRLALQLAQDRSEQFDGNVFVVELAPITDVGLVLSAIASAVGVPKLDARPLGEALAASLGRRPALLLLDNFEHVTGAIDDVLELLGTCPTLKVLATSRVRLRVRGEHEVAVPPLALPTLEDLPPLAALGEYAALRLFVERTRELRPDFRLSAENAATVAEICWRLDGLPLAIELAAARTKVLSPGALLSRLTHRLELLTGGPRDLPARLRTMRDAIGWSYDLLGPDDQALFRRLAVFRGSLSLEAAEAVGGRGGEVALPSPPPVLDGLTSLIDHSLMRREQGPDGDDRFVLLETLCEFGLEQLAAHGEEAATRRQHAAWFLAVAERAEPEARGPAQTLWLNRLETEHDNLRAALEWAIQHDPDTGLRLSGLLWQFWKRKGHPREGRTWLERALAAAPNTPSPYRAAGLLVAGDLSRRLSDFDAAAAHLDESLALSQELADSRGRVRALHFLGMTYQDCGKRDRGHTHFTEALTLARQLGARWEMADALNSLGNLALDNADFERAKAFYQESLCLCRELGNKTGRAATLNNLGEVATAQGDSEQARRLLTDALALYREVGDGWGIAIALHSLGELATSQGHHEQAEAYLAESLLRFQRLGDVSRVERCVWSLAGLAIARGDVARGVRLYGAQRAERERFGNVAALPIGQVTYDRDMAVAHEILGQREFAATWARGRAMSLEEAIAEAVEGSTALSAGTAGEQGAGRDAATADLGLTVRELEVLRLLAEGHSDRAIATALFISPVTVTTHVKHILRKFGVSSRTAAAAIAARRGVI